MLKLSTDEINVIRKADALPKSVIARRLAELLDEMLTLRDKTEFETTRLFAIEMRKWLKTLKLFSKSEQEVKKEDFI